MTEQEYLNSGGSHCIECGSENFEGGEMNFYAGEASQEVSCNDCNAEWQDNYTLVGVTNPLKIDTAEISHEKAQEVILAAEEVARNAESNDQEISLFSAFFDSAVALLSEDQFKLLARSVAQNIDGEIAHEPCDAQTEYVDKIKSLTKT